MKVRFIDLDNDYSDICSWWEQYKYPNIPKDMLSTTGFIVESDNKKLLAGWVYHTNSNVGMLEFVVGNPEFKGEIRDKAFEVFFDVVFKYTELSSIKNIISTTSHNTMPNRFEKVGFIKVNDNVSNFMRSV